MSELIEVFPSEQHNSSYIRGIVLTEPDMVSKLMVNDIIWLYVLIVFFAFQTRPYGFESKDKNLLKYIMVTKLGSGPKRVADHLLNNDGTLKSK